MVDRAVVTTTTTTTTTTRKAKYPTKKTNCVSKNHETNFHSIRDTIGRAIEATDLLAMHIVSRTHSFVRSNLSIIPIWLGTMRIIFFSVTLRNWIGNRAQETHG